MEGWTVCIGWKSQYHEGLIYPSPIDPYLIHSNKISIGFFIEFEKWF